MKFITITAQIPWHIINSTQYYKSCWRVCGEYLPIDAKQDTPYRNGMQFGSSRDVLKRTLCNGDLYIFLITLKVNEILTFWKGGWGGGAVGLFSCKSK